MKVNFKRLFFSPQNVLVFNFQKSIKLVIRPRPEKWNKKSVSVLCVCLCLCVCVHARMLSAFVCVRAHVLCPCLCAPSVSLLCVCPCLRVCPCMHTSTRSHTDCLPGTPRHPGEARADRRSPTRPGLTPAAGSARPQVGGSSRPCTWEELSIYLRLHGPLGSPRPGVQTVPFTRPPQVCTPGIRVLSKLVPRRGTMGLRHQPSPHWQAPCHMASPSLF